MLYADTFFSKPDQRGARISIRDIRVSFISKALYDMLVMKKSVLVLDDEKEVAKIASLEDLAWNRAQQLILEEVLGVWTQNFGGYDEKTAVVIDSLSHEQRIVEDAKLYLRPSTAEKSHYSVDSDVVESGYPEPQNDTPKYQLVSTGTAVYIVVEQGFLDEVEKDGGKLAFYSQVMKVFYGLMPIASVNQSEWYRQYLKAVTG